MHRLITRYLEKKGIADITKLTSDEKATIEQWESIFKEGEVTVEKLAELARREVAKIEGQWRNLDNAALKNERLVIGHVFWKTLLEMIVGPKANVEALEKYLVQLTDG